MADVSVPFGKGVRVFKDGQPVYKVAVSEDGRLRVDTEVQGEDRGIDWTLAQWTDPRWTLVRDGNRYVFEHARSMALLSYKDGHGPTVLRMSWLDLVERTFVFEPNTDEGFEAATEKRPAHELFPELA
jgi:hypothetical protein